MLEPLAKLMSGNWLPHSSAFSGWNFGAWNHHAPHSSLKMHSKWDCHSSTQSFASGSLDFLTFRSFISLPTLIIFYYLGALILPIMTWFFCFQCIKKLSFIHIPLHKGQQLIWQTLDAKQQGMMVLLFILMIGMAELFWRMIFEFLIAYMQIHDALVTTLGES